MGSNGCNDRFCTALFFYCAARKHPPTFWNDLLGVTRGGGQQATSIVAGARIKCPHTLVVFPFCMGSNIQSTDWSLKFGSPVLMLRMIHDTAGSFSHVYKKGELSCLTRLRFVAMCKVQGVTDFVKPARS